MELQDPPSPQPEYNMNHLGVGSVAIVLSSSDCALSAGLIEEYGGELLMAPAIGRNLVYVKQISFALRCCVCLIFPKQRSYSGWRPQRLFHSPEPPDACKSIDLGTGLDSMTP